jgi:hypothetical protein
MSAAKAAGPLQWQPWQPAPCDGLQPHTQRLCTAIDSTPRIDASLNVCAGHPHLYLSQIQHNCNNRQVQEADIRELSADEFESMLASSEYDFYSASEGLDADLGQF